MPRIQRAFLVGIGEYGLMTSVGDKRKLMAQDHPKPSTLNMQQDGSRSEEKQLGLFFIPLLVYLKLCQS
jgi:hypothetical protein